MIFIAHYKSPLGDILLAAKYNKLIGLWMENQKNNLSTYKEKIQVSENNAILKKVKKWLDRYFNNEKPSINELKLELRGSDFRRKVWKILTGIPYGSVITYKDIAKKMAFENGIKRMSAQAVGGAVGNNPISIIIPCHRVVGTSGYLTGYSGGLEKKKYLLEHEGINLKQYKLSNKEILIKKRCKWCNLKNPLYIEYHDKEWGVPNFSEEYLFEMLILESFQAGLSWECILNKREAFKKAYDNFNIEKICLYDDVKINELLNNKNIIRNRLKIEASINNSKIFKEIQKEYSSFFNYLKRFTGNKIYYELNKTHSNLSDTISKDLKKRGMKFVGTTIIYSYLQAIGIIYAHDSDCWLYKKD